MCGRTAEQDAELAILQVATNVYCSWVLQEQTGGSRRPLSAPHVTSMPVRRLGADLPFIPAIDAALRRHGAATSLAQGNALPPRVGTATQALAQRDRVQA